MLKMESLLLSPSRPSASAPISTAQSIWRDHSHTFKKACFSSSYGLHARRTNAFSLFNKYSVGYHLKDSQSRSTYQRRDNKTCLVSAAAASQPPSESEAKAQNPKKQWDSIKDAANIIYQFCAVYVIMGTVLNVISVSLLAVEKFSDLTPSFYMGLLQALVPCVFMNIFITGVNQLTDIDIDKVNKPDRLLPSGKLSIRAGVMLVTFFLIMSICIGFAVGSRPLLWAIFTKFVIGVGYSVDIPLLRWKKSAITAAMTIVALRAMTYPIWYFLHMQTHVFRRPAVLSRSVTLTIAISSLFAVVIALAKDLPDIEGDKKFGIQSLAISLGAKRVLGISVLLIQMAYVVAVIAGLTSSNQWSKVITVSGHAILSFILWAQAKSVNLESKAALQSFYMFVWKLIYAEYALVPFLR